MDSKSPNSKNMSKQGGESYRQGDKDVNPEWRTKDHAEGVRDWKSMGNRNEGK